MDRSTLLHDLSLILLELGSWNENEGDLSYRRAWKGLSYDVLDTLSDEGFITGAHQSKSVALTSDGRTKAAQLMDAYGIVLDREPEPQRFFRLRLAFDFTDLHCSRTLLVPEHTTFEDFHTQIQACLNWMNYHLYDFSFVADGEPLFVSWPNYETGGDPREEFMMPGQALPRWINSATACLDEYLPCDSEMVYHYDYGDDWAIKITVLNRGERIASDVPICWEGAGDAPPEDVGGEWGFKDLLHVMADPGDYEHQQATAWAKGQGFEHFSKSLANRRLAHWKDFARIDTNMMPASAQIAAFGHVVAEPKVADPWGTGQLRVIEGGAGSMTMTDADRYESYKTAADKNHADNEAYLALFESSLRADGLKPKTIANHLSNMDFYLNDYLNYSEAITMKTGIECGYVRGFLGDWFIEKAGWSSVTSIRGNATSIKKFYRCMANEGLVTQEAYRELVAMIKEELPDFVAAFRAYEHGDGDWWI